MARRVTVAFAVVGALLVVTAAPVAASDTQVISIHTTPSDFEAGTVGTFQFENSGQAGQLAWRGGDTGTALTPTVGASTSGTDKLGFEFVPEQPLDGVEVDIEGDANTVYLLDSSGTVLTQGSNTGTVELLTANPLSVGERYYVAIDSGGSLYGTNTVSETGSTAELDVTGKGYNGGQVDTQYAVSSIAGITGTVDTEYVSTAHDVDNAVDGFVDLGAVSDAEAAVTWQGYDGSGWVDVASQTYTTAGNKSLALSGGYSQWRVIVETSHTSTDTYDVVIEDEGVTATTSAPSVDDSSASPQGGTTLTSAPTLSIDGSDDDFGTAQGDSVTAEWYVDGELAGTTTETSGGTWTFDPDTATGDFTWSVEVTDSYGHTASSGTFSATSPGELRVYNEQQPANLVDNTTLRVRFFDDGVETVVERRVQDGTVDLSGLDASERLIVTVQDEGTDFQYRRVVIDSFYDQQDVYLLPDNATAADINFRLQDATGQFPSESSTLFIERPLTKDFDDDGTNETRYRTIAGDNFGAAEDFPTTLALNERYRLRVENRDGETRVLGAYTPSGDTIEPLPIGTVSFQPENASSGVFNAELVTTDSGQRVIRVTYIDTSVETSELTLGITTEDGNTTLEPNSTVTGPFGTYRATYPLPSSAPEDVTYEITYEAVRDGQTRGDRVYVGSVPDVPDFGIRPGLFTLGGYIGIVAVLGFTAIKRPAYAGLPTTAVAGFLTAIGVVAIPPLFIGGAGVVSLLFAAGGDRV